VDGQVAGGSADTDPEPLRGVNVVSLALNVPGPAAAARLVGLGAAVTKVEPPHGDPLAHAYPAWYAELHSGQDVVALDLARRDGRERLTDLLRRADLLLTSSRPATLARVDLGWERLHSTFSRLAHVAIVGHPAPDHNRPGHDLTYVAEHGLVAPPELPRTLVADLGGAERAVSAALAVLLARERGGPAAYAEVALSAVAAGFAAPLLHGATAPGGTLGGGLPYYGLYEAREEWVALAALELPFRARLAAALGLGELTHDALAEAFRARTAAEWETWARERDLPLAAVRRTARRDPPRTPAGSAG
jgi:alpha-methylacyl-CoA racemase